MRFDIITIFPDIFDSYFNESMIKRARAKKLVDICVHNLRDFVSDKKKKGLPASMRSFGRVDDTPYGGGAGMVLMAEPILRAVAKIKPRSKTKIVVFSAKGRQFTQKMAYDWAKKYGHFVFITGRYEGIDERVSKILKVEEISIGPYVMTDGDVAAMAVVSALTRLIPNVINWTSLQEESFRRGTLTKEAGGMLEYPHYTRPEVVVWPSPGRGKKGKKYRVPKVLLSGDHKKIAAWRRMHQGKVR